MPNGSFATSHSAEPSSSSRSTEIVERGDPEKRSSDRPSENFVHRASRSSKFDVRWIPLPTFFLFRSVSLQTSRELALRRRSVGKRPNASRVRRISHPLWKSRRGSNVSSHRLEDVDNDKFGRQNGRKAERRGMEECMENAFDDLDGPFHQRGLDGTSRLTFKREIPTFRFVNLSHENTTMQIAVMPIGGSDARGDSPSWEDDARGDSPSLATDPILNRGRHRLRRRFPLGRGMTPAPSLVAQLLKASPTFVRHSRTHRPPVTYA